MPDYYLTHPLLPDQPVTVHVEDGAELSPEYVRAGWVITDPPPEPYDEPDNSPPPVAAAVAGFAAPDPAKSRRFNNTPTVPAAEVAEPNTEQAPAELDTPKE